MVAKDIILGKIVGTRNALEIDVFNENVNACFMHIANLTIYFVSLQKIDQEKYREVFNDLMNKAENYYLSANQIELCTTSTIVDSCIQYKKNKYQ